MSSVKIFVNFRVSIRDFFFSFREKILKTTLENINCVHENFFQITYVKMEMSVREKFNQIFTWKLVKLIFYYTREKKILPWKLSKIR